MLSLSASVFVAVTSLALSFEKPLSSGHLDFCDNLRRLDIALERPMDLSNAEGVSFELRCMDPAVVENVWLLLKSGAGYYRAAAEKPTSAGVWVRTVVAKSDVRLYHWDAHVSLWEKMEHPADKDLPDWSRIEGFQIVVAIDIDATSRDASVSARGFIPVVGHVAPRPPVLPPKQVAVTSGERQLLCTHVWGVDHNWNKTCRDLVPYGITDISPLIAHGGYAYYKTRFGVEHPLVVKYGDALRLSVAACHKYGMKCHPRRSCWSLGFHASAETLAAFRKDARLQVGFDGREGAWLCPTHPANLRREVEGMLELAEAGADGIMVDFFRYPNVNFCFCPRCRARFEMDLGHTVEPWPQAVRSVPKLAQEWSRFRCDVMSEAFAEVARQVKAAAPQIELSAAVSATVKGGEDRGQDWPRWCRDGGLDVLYPMCYYSTHKMLSRDLVGLQAAVTGTRTKLVPMIAFASGDIPFVEPEEFARQIGVLQSAGIRDRAFFRLQEYAPVCLGGVFGRAEYSRGERRVMTAEPELKLGMAGYTFKAVKDTDALLANLNELGVKYLCVKDFHLPFTATDAEIAAFVEKCRAHGVVPYAIGPIYMKDEAKAVEAFEFARKLGVKTVVGVPYEVAPGKEDKWGPDRLESRKLCTFISTLCARFDMRYAIHNHGPSLPNLFPNAESVWRKVADLDPRMGLCLDLAHERRSGFDPAESVRRYAVRLFDVHLNNIEDASDPEKYLATTLPKGVVDISAVCTALKSIGYDGVLSIEYAKNFNDNMADLHESVDYFRTLNTEEK